jgi:hypothetical protein
MGDSGMAAGNYQHALTVSLQAGADLSGAGVGEYRFGKINPAEVTSYPNPDNPGEWYGSPGGPPAIPAGNVIVNTTNGGKCAVLIAGKAKASAPIECVFSGIGSVVLGTGGCTAGDELQSDATGAAVTVSGGGVSLGTALETGVAGQQISILFRGA